MAQADISISIDEGLKEQAESLFSKLGMNMSMAISIFLRQTVQQGKIPVDVSEDESDDDTPLLISDEICPYCHHRHAYRGKEMRDALEEAERISRDPHTKRYASFSEIVAEIEAEISNEV
jgi:DNA-damage-inducible protein J